MYTKNYNKSRLFTPTANRYECMSMLNRAAKRKTQPTTQNETLKGNNYR